MRLTFPSLIVLVGPSGAGKSTWAAQRFASSEIVSSDAIRGLVGLGEHDQRAGTDAFEVLHDVVDRRLKRGLLTVVDTLGLDPDLRSRWRQLAASHGLPCYAVAFATPERECRSRNRTRDPVVPSKVLSAQLKSMADVRASLPAEGFDAVLEDDDVELVPSAFAGAGTSATRQAMDPVRLRFGLQIPRFDMGDGPLGARLASVAAAAEEAGFSSIWVMDHFIQIPQAGREWDDMLDSWTTLAFLAAHTRRVTLGPLVAGVTYRNVAHLAKIAATLDVLSQGRAICGIGAAWFEREHTAYGWDFPPVRDRFALLEDALELLPLMWGPGTPAYKGRVIEVAEALCYPRPVGGSIPILIGGSGEKRTLRLVARFADACNLFGDPATIAHKVSVLAAHCADVGRDPAAIEVTNLSTVLVGRSRPEVDDLVSHLAPAGASPRAFASATNAGTVDDHVGRFRAFAEAGVDQAIVNMPALDEASLERFASVVDRYRDAED